MTYHVNSIFLTLQGEGVHTGRAAIFVRFSICNLWTGKEKDRATAICRFCDTDFTASRPYTRDDLIAAIDACWTGDRPMLVFTGGEPLLQLDAPLITRLRSAGYYVAVETNGTKLLPAPLDWVCVSPKANTDTILTCGDELKLVYPQAGATPDMFVGYRFGTFWLSPMDGPDYADNLKQAIDYCLHHPRWRLNIQTHKQIGIP